jgi:hypothetical protein
MLAKVKAFFVTLKTQLADIWNRSKIFILAVGALIVALEFQKIKEALLVYAGKKEIQSDNKKDTVLADQENKANSQADALVQQAKDLPGQETQVKPDWYKEDK